MQVLLTSPLTDFAWQTIDMTDSPKFKLGPTPDVFVQDIQPATAQVHLVRLSESQYRAASFLDQRILGEGCESGWASWDTLATGARDLPARLGPDFIFHIGHVGSTLLSRILGDHPAVHALREPLWMRTMSAALLEVPATAHLPPPLSPSEAIAVLTRWTARTFRPDQRAQVKATSFASELAPFLIPASPQSRVLGLTAAPQIHMATLMAGENNLTEVNFMGPSRIARLNRRISTLNLSWNALSHGERLAATWASEMTSLSAALSVAGPAAMALDFDALLKDPPAVLHAVLMHLHGRADPAHVHAMAASPHFSRYSKAQSHEYSPQLRSQILNEAWRAHSDELKKGLSWLQQTIRANADLGRLLGPFLGA